ncbi:PIG-L family deacetylase [Dermacoccaceae bacterium W4C1]
MRLLAIHAHPDDETLASGITLAHHVGEGDQVHVLTMTLGEEGEVIPAELAHLELPAGAPRDPNAADPLGDFRRGELAAAMDTLGVTSWSVLGDHGGPTRRDSGMIGTPSAAHPKALVGADLDEVAAQVRHEIERLDPDVVATYDPHGGYRHPDHVRTHQAVVEAVRTMPAADRPLLVGIVTPHSWYEADQAWLAREFTDERRRLWSAGPPDPADHSASASVVPDELVSFVTIDPSVLDLQHEVLTAHRTQVRLLPQMFVLSNDIATRTAGREAFAVIDPDTGGWVAPQQPAALADRPGLGEAR